MSNRLRGALSFYCIPPFRGGEIVLFWGVNKMYVTEWVDGLDDYYENMLQIFFDFLEEWYEES